MMLQNRMTQRCRLHIHMPSPLTRHMPMMTVMMKCEILGCLLRRTPELGFTHHATFGCPNNGRVHLIFRFVHITIFCLEAGSEVWHFMQYTKY